MCRPRRPGRRPAGAPLVAALHEKIMVSDFAEVLEESVDLTTDAGPLTWSARNSLSAVIWLALWVRARDASISAFRRYYVYGLEEPPPSRPWRVLQAYVGRTIGRLV